MIAPPVPHARLDEVARVLRLIAEMPGRRERPRPGDREGPFDVWFDGGACQYTTDVNRFDLDDGGSAWISTSSPGLEGGVGCNAHSPGAGARSLRVKRRIG